MVAALLLKQSDLSLPWRDWICLLKSGRRSICPRSAMQGSSWPSTVLYQKVSSQGSLCPNHCTIRIHLLSLALHELLVIHKCCDTEPRGDPAPKIFSCRKRIDRGEIISCRVRVQATPSTEYWTGAVAAINVSHTGLVYRLSPSPHCLKTENAKSLGTRRGRMSVHLAFSALCVSVLKELNRLVDEPYMV